MTWYHPALAQRTIRALDDDVAKLRAENERLTLENWQLKGVLGYPVPGDTPESKEFKCGLCEARRLNG